MPDSNVFQTLNTSDFPEEKTEPAPRPRKPTEETVRVEKIDLTYDGE